MRRPIDRRRPGLRTVLPCVLAAAALLVSAALLAGCSFDYRSTSLDEELAEEVPNTVLRGVEHTVMSGDRVTAVLRIDRVESYHERDLVILSGIHFTEFDSDGGVVAEAWADRAEYHSKTGDARAEGSVVVSSAREDARITAAGLSWNDTERTLSGGEGAEVVLERGDGSTLTGVGFEADIARRIIRYLGPVSGSMVVDR
jgi:LPS export ABC transporter protein LptC